MSIKCMFLLFVLRFYFKNPQIHFSTSGIKANNFIHKNKYVEKWKTPYTYKTAFFVVENFKNKIFTY